MIRQDTDRKYIFTTLFYFLVYIFWITNIFGSTDFGGVGADLQSKIALFLNYRYPTGRGFFFVEWATCILSIYLIKKYNKHYIAPKGIISFIFFASIPIFILVLLNPNNTEAFYFSLLTQKGKFIIFFPLFMYALCFLENDLFAEVLKELLRIGYYVLSFKIFLAFLLYLSGNGMDWAGQNVPFYGSDILYYTSIYQVISLILFLVLKKKRYLFFSTFLLIIMILSQRRTETLGGIIVNCFVILFFLFKSTNKKQISKIVFFVASLILIIIITESFGITIFSDLWSRQLSALSYFNPEWESKTISDSGHIKQAILTSESAWEFLRFWGAGLNAEYFYLSGQSFARPHNSFAFGMVQYGIFIPIFYAVLFCIFFYMMIKFWFKSIEKEFELWHLIQFMTTCLLVLYFISGWASSKAIFDRYPQDYISFILVLSFFKIDKMNSDSFIFNAK